MSGRCQQRLSRCVTGLHLCVLSHTAVVPRGYLVCSLIPQPIHLRVPALRSRDQSMLNMLKRFRRFYAPIGWLSQHRKIRKLKKVRNISERWRASLRHVGVHPSFHSSYYLLSILCELRSDVWDTHPDLNHLNLGLDAYLDIIHTVLRERCIFCNLKNRTKLSSGMGMVLRF